VIDRVLIRSADRTLNGADDAGRNGAVVAERIADRDNRVPDTDAVGIAERERRQSARTGVDLQDGEVWTDPSRRFALSCCRCSRS